MRLGSYYWNGLRMGAVVGSQIFDLRSVYELYLIVVQHDPRAGVVAKRAVPDDMVSFIEVNHGRLEGIDSALRWAVDGFQEGEDKKRFRAQGITFDLSQIELLPPILRPSKIVCIGSSYASHVTEGSMRATPPGVKVSFLKAPSSVCGPREVIRFPRGSSFWDYETELAIVVGDRCKDVTEKRSRDCIFGYTILNDISTRDVPPILGGLTSPAAKSADMFAPIGPWVVTADEIENPGELRLRTFVNNELRQEANTKDLLWSIESIVQAVSAIMTLEPGDIISTGTPGGTGHGIGKYLAPGDVVRSEIEQIGILEVTIGGSEQA